MCSYFVAQITITDPEEYQRYLDGYDEIFARYKGKVIAVDDRPTVLEGRWERTRFVMIRFPDDAELRAWYDSPEYQQLVRHRWNASQADVYIVHGRE